MLLVRKTGTRWFMQAGGKIEANESPAAALQRELHEEIGLFLDEEGAQYLGSFSAPAANETGYTVEAELFHVRILHDPVLSSEIEEAVWVDEEAAKAMPLAPLTRYAVLPLSRTLLGRNRLRRSRAR